MGQSMLNKGLALFILFFTCFFNICNGEPCSKVGWFGDECMFLCHCANGSPCNQTDGSCNNGCDSKWFGPACQYSVSQFTIVSNRLTSNLSRLNDNSDKTCNDENVQSITVALDTPHALSWVRVIVRNSANLDQFELSYRSNKSQAFTRCDNLRSAKVDDRTLDISCPTSNVVSQVTLSGNVVRGLCSLYISGGRNVAFQQSAQQSTTQGNWNASNAVDGHIDNPGVIKSQESTCSHTKPGLDGWWKVTFSNKVEINRLIIHNRRDPVRSGCCESRLMNFTVEIFSNPGDKSVYKYTDPGDLVKDVYTVTLPNRTVVSSGTVRIDVFKNTKNKIVTLCEVYVYGDVICKSEESKPKKFGRHCDRDCNCADQTEACFVSTGGCPFGCAAGFTGEDCYTSCPNGKYGLGCGKNCSSNCAPSANICENVDGLCSGGCKPGYKEPLCTEKCPAGTFGLKCTQNCSTHCTGRDNACNHVDGTCNGGCDPGYKTAHCNISCEEGKYGSGCNETCSPYCAQLNKCDSVNGSCHGGCMTGYKAPLCKDKCPIGKYGPGCSQTCSNTCKGEGNPCHHIDGGCLQGCDPGYQGNQCKQECTLGTYGQNCSEKCNENCGGPNNTCDHINGTCTDGCDDGYRNAKCDTPCARGKYGSGCSLTCKASCAGQGDPCHHVDGICLYGCDPGYWGDKCRNKCYRGKYGPGCSKNCSVTCTGYKNPCHHVNGECSKGCDVGFVGSYCKEKCPFGKFGLGCSKNCSIHCAGLDNVCHHVDGTCTLGCDAGYKPAQCNMTCDPGTYGKNCSETCSEHCSGEPNTCNNVEGTCVNGCDFGYLSPMCKLECPPTKYGQDCKQDCGEKCLYNECDHVTGKCSSCVDGYKNDFCEQECNATTYGSSCNQSCSTDCVDQLCHHVTGKCYQFAEQQGAGVGEATIPALICVILIILVATLVLVAVIIWRRHKEDKHGHAKNRTAKLGRMTYANLSSSSAKRESSAGQARSHVVNVNRANEDNTEEEDEIETADSPYNNTSTAATAIAVQDLKAYLHQHSTNSHFKDQFMAVPMETGRRQRHGLASHNSRKNRYKNIIPYDHTRVLLFADEDNDMSNYINASHVKDYYGNAMFIASQAPNETILADFVRMLWEQGVDRVVMLTNLIELGKRKCTMYWPEDSEEIFGDITVQLLTTRVFAEYTIRHLRLSTGIEPPRDLTHFHFTAWPDKSVPENPWGLVDFYHRVMASPGTGPLLVHCSAGVGRTGTFIALCNLLEEAKATGKMNFRTTLFKLRQDRMHMIQTAAQYTFLHKTALVAHMTSGTTIQVQDIAAKFHSLEGGASGDESARSYQEEFDDVAAVCDEDTIMCDDQTTRAEEVYGNEKVMANKCKDRLSNILPNSTFRPILSAIKPGENTYINAVLVPNLTRNNQDILTQLPLPSTVTDFWRLVTQFNVRMVVAFEVDSRATDETIAGFLPETDFEKFQTEEIEISSTTVNENSTLKHMSLAIQEKETQGLSPSSPELTCLLCKNTSLNPESVLELVEKIQSCRPTENYRTVYMCRNGAEHSGLVCILSILLDRLKVDNCLTVPLVVGAIKAIRPQVIPTVDQYKCLYQVLRLHYEEMNVYGNI